MKNNFTPFISPLFVVGHSGANVVDGPLHQPKSNHTTIVAYSPFTNYIPESLAWPV